MQSVTEANSDLIIKSLPVVRALPGTNAASEPRFWGVRVEVPMTRAEVGGAGRGMKKAEAFQEKG